MMVLSRSTHVILLDEQWPGTGGPKITRITFSLSLLHNVPEESLHVRLYARVYLLCSIPRYTRRRHSIMDVCIHVYTSFVVYLGIRIGYQIWSCTLKYLSSLERYATRSFVSKVWRSIQRLGFWCKITFLPCLGRSGCGSHNLT